jgi:hypothetical protein
MLSELTARQTSAAYHVGEIYGRFEWLHGRRRMHRIIGGVEIEDDCPGSETTFRETRKTSLDDESRPISEAQRRSSALRTRLCRIRLMSVGASGSTPDDLRARTSLSFAMARFPLLGSKMPLQAKMPSPALLSG